MLPHSMSASLSCECTRSRAPAPLQVVSWRAGHSQTPAYWDMTFFSAVDRLSEIRRSTWEEETFPGCPGMRQYLGMWDTIRVWESRSCVGSSLDSFLIVLQFSGKFFPWWNGPRTNSRLVDVSYCVLCNALSFICEHVLTELFSWLLVYVAEWLVGWMDGWSAEHTEEQGEWLCSLPSTSRAVLWCVVVTGSGV